MGDAVNELLAVCYAPDDWVGAGLSPFMWFPLVLWAAVLFVHLIARDIFSLLEFSFAYSAVWTVAFSVQWGLRGSRPNLDTCATLGIYGRYGMPDTWLVSTTVYVLTWLVVVLYYRRRLMWTGCGLATVGWLGFVAAARYNNYVTWEQWSVSLSVALLVTLLNVAVVVGVLRPALAAVSSRVPLAVAGGDAFNLILDDADDSLATAPSVKP